MNEKELDKMINNVVASFQIDGIKVSPELICKMKKKFLYEDSKTSTRKCLVKKERK